MAFTGEFVYSSLGTSEGRSGRAPVADEGLDGSAVAAVNGVGICAVYGNS
jgi:hypothetical protein